VAVLVVLAVVVMVRPHHQALLVKLELRTPAVVVAVVLTVVAMALPAAQEK
jgi:hypothetical protein